MVVLTILVLFAVIAGPRLIGALMTSRLDSALEAIRDDLAFARARAVSTGLRHQVVVDTGTGELIVQPFHPEDQVAGASGGATSTGEPDVALRDRLDEAVQIVEWSVLPLGIETGAVTGTSAANGILTLYPEGRSDGLRVVLQGEDERRRGLMLDTATLELRELEQEELAQ